MKTNCALTLFLIAHTLTASITINHVDITQLAEPGDTITFECELPDNVVLSCGNNNFSIDFIDAEKAFALQKAAQESLAQEEVACEQIERNVILQHKEADIFYARRYFFSTADMLAFACLESMSFKQCVLDAAKAVFLVADCVNLDSCFIKAPVMRLEAQSEDAFIQLIQVTFFDNEVPHMVDGRVYLDNGIIKRPCMLCGVKRVEILFHPDAFYN